MSTKSSADALERRMRKGADAAPAMLISLTEPVPDPVEDEDEDEEPDDEEFEGDEDEDEPEEDALSWTATREDIAAADAAVTPAEEPVGVCELAPATDEDYDRFWDWVRSDEDHGESLFGEPVTTYRNMLTRLSRMQRVLAMIRDGAHIGIVGLDRVDAPPEMPVVGHLYIAPAHRGIIPRVMDEYLKVLDAQILQGRKLMVVVRKEALMRLYRPHGFTVSYLMVWPSPL